MRVYCEQKIKLPHILTIYSKTVICIKHIVTKSGFSKQMTQNKYSASFGIIMTTRSDTWFFKRS